MAKTRHGDGHDAQAEAQKHQWTISQPRPFLIYGLWDGGAQTMKLALVNV